MCDEYSWDCGDCGGEITDENGYCDNDLIEGDRNQPEVIIPIKRMGRR
jgi:hypothetical protein